MFCVNFAIYRLNSVNPGLLPLSIFLLFSRDLHVVLASEAPVQDLLSWVTPGLVASSRDLLPHVSIHLCQVCPEHTGPPVLTSLSATPGYFGELRKLLDAHCPAGCGEMSQSSTKTC